MQSVRILFLLFLLSPVALAQKSTPESECKEHQKTVGQALASYSETFGGKPGLYPRRLKELAPEFIKKVPQCPTGGKYYYSDDMLSPGNDAGFQAFYLLRCKYHRHLGFTRDRGIVNPTKMKIPHWAEDLVRRSMKSRQRTRRGQ